MLKSVGIQYRLDHLVAMARHFRFENIGEYFELALEVFCRGVELALGNIIAGKSHYHRRFWARAQLINYRLFGLLGEFRFGAIDSLANLGNHSAYIFTDIKFGQNIDRTLSGGGIDLVETIQGL